MTAVRKVKVSITLSEQLVDRIDREAARQPGQTRSGVIESWLWRASRRAASARLAAETIAYYESLSEVEREEDQQWADFSTGELARLDDD
jgi:metal-responsive CopG/Arc/MetJ family transcriptional regulator